MQKIEIDDANFLANAKLKAGDPKRGASLSCNSRDRNRGPHLEQHTWRLSLEPEAHVSSFPNNASPGGFYAIMSTFSSVVNKSGKKFAPKATARRNVPPKANADSTTPIETPEPTSQPALTSLPVSDDFTVSAATQQAQNPTAENTAPVVQASEPLLPCHSAIPSGLLLADTTPAESKQPSVEASAEISQVRKDGIGAKRTTNQRKTHQGRVAERQANIETTGTSSKEASEQKSVRSVSGDRHDPRPQEIFPEPAVLRTPRVTRGGKRKSDTQDSDTVEVTPGYAAADPAFETDVGSTTVPPTRKRRKTLPRGPAPASDTDVAQDFAAISRDVSVDRTPTIAISPDNQALAQPTRSLRKRRAKKTLAEVAADIVAEAVGEETEDDDADDADDAAGSKTKNRRSKKLSAEEAEAHEIAPTEVKMFDLIKDKGLGKKSRLESRMEEIDWDEVKKKRKEADEEAEKQRELDREERRTGITNRQEDMPVVQTAPLMKIVGGEIVMDEESRVIDRHAPVPEAGSGPAEIREVDDVTKRINQSTIGRQPGVKQKGHWNEEMTDLFYKGLRMFGTDFMMISKMFPSMSRRHVKLKYTREERANLSRIHENLKSREEVNMDEFSEMTNQVYGDQARVYEEMEADADKLRAEDVARRAREAEAEQGILVDEEDTNVLKSREQGTAEPTGEDGVATGAAEGESSAKENRFASVARSIVHAAAAPKKQQKKTTALARKRDKKKRTGLEGTEEVVGSIEDV